MPFRYPDMPHVRLHGPAGYSRFGSFRPWLRDEFQFRCVYCLKREQWGVARGTYHQDHFIPQAVNFSTAHDYDNLLYACATCNAAKGVEVVPDPCACMIRQDIALREDGSIVGRSSESRKLIRVLGLDSPEFREFRRLWIDIIALARAFEPDLFRRLMKYPDDLPNLSKLRPPNNTRPDGVKQSCFARRERGELPEIH